MKNALTIILEIFKLKDKYIILGLKVSNLNVKILTDSACDLTEQYFEKYSIEMVPLTVHLEDKDYRDNIDISPKEVYDAMREGATTKTSQVSLQTFEEIFTRYAEANQPLVYLAFSSELSGTYQTAQMMLQTVKEKYPDAPLHIVDTKCASIGFGLVVLRAAKLAQEGATAEEIIAMANRSEEHTSELQSRGHLVCR